MLKFKLGLVFALALGTAVYLVPAFAEDDTPLAQSMDEISSPYKRLRRIYKDPAKKDETLGYLRTMLEYSAKSKTYKPAYLKKQAAAEQAAFLDAYHKQMNNMIRAILEMEEAVMKGDAAAATAAYTKLKNAKSDGHEKFIEE